MPRLMVPSKGGGTKLMRTLRAAETEGICPGAGGGVVDSFGEIERAGDSSGGAEAIGVGDSCAAPIETKIASRSEKLTLVVMSSEVETSRTFSENIQRLTRSSPDSLAATLAAQPSMSLVPLAPLLDFARDDKWPRCNIASSRLEKGCRAIRSRAGTFHQHDL